jgi:hypothetical protein
MKKQLIIGTALLAAMNLLSQNARVKPQTNGTVGNMAEIAALKYGLADRAPSQNTSPAPSGNVVQPATPAQAPQGKSAAQPPSSATWKLLCGSSNCYGMLVSSSRPLQYNDNVNAVSFIHRKSDSYTETPPVGATAKTGVIVAEFSTDWGTTFDSTCIWANSTNWARYPQGAIYSAPGNTNIANAYVVGSGPTTGASSWTGSWYASKKLYPAGSPSNNTTPDMTPGAQQFMSISASTYAPSQAKHGWPRQGFSFTDDGFVHSLGQIAADHTNLGTAAKTRGAAVVKGTFNAGIFDWTVDSLIPSTIKDKDSVKQISYGSQMAWNESGTTGYVMMLGAVTGATLNNKGIHPIIYKTTDAGVNWTLIPGLDFNSTGLAPILDHIASISPSSSVTIPFFWDYDLVVDTLGKLHIGALLGTAASDHNDSLFYYSQYNLAVNPGNNYKWGHSPGNRPYVYDFIGDGSAPWIFKTIDSLSTEDPGTTSASTGFTLNPWDADAGSKISVDNRLQMGRTPNGKYITFSWADSDTSFITDGLKYNVKPNITTRCMAVGSGTNLYQLSPTEIVVTGIAPQQIAIREKAFLHYMSPTTGAATCLAASLSSHTIDIKTPFTITNNGNVPMGQLTSNTTWYGKTSLSYVFSGSVLPCAIVGIEELTGNEFSGSIIFPNPAKDRAVLTVELNNQKEVTVEIYSVVGQLVKASSSEAVEGENNIQLDLSGLPAGVYLVKAKAGNKSATKKLIIQ